ncbi:hypothetical protein OIE68_02345 [Nocardia vinacea]|uniref:Uncharacterized protein n=1 Tax=Nocardia vinacea TaxID=96468 RepID=A0ABZ1YQS4_9NOCA|nr:hypothetical protein OIE68_02345 [Nocardia vinacea]
MARPTRTTRARACADSGGWRRPELLERRPPGVIDGEAGQVQDVARLANQSAGQRASEIRELD